MTKQSLQHFALSHGLPGAYAQRIFELGTKQARRTVGSYSNCEGGSGLAHAFAAMP